MLTRLLSFWQSPPSEVQRQPQERTFHPNLERLEERDVPSANPLDGFLGLNPGLVPIQFNFLTNPQVTQPGQYQFTALGSVGVNPRENSFHPAHYRRPP